MDFPSIQVFLKKNSNNRKILLPQAFFLDLNLFCTFLDTYNGVTYYDNNDVDAHVHLDASGLPPHGLFSMACHLSTFRSIGPGNLMPCGLI